MFKLFKRLGRLIKGLFGAAVDAAESPTRVLEQNLRDMQDKLPEYNNNIAKAKGQQRMTENKAKARRRHADDMRAKAKAAAREDKDELARKFIIRMQKAEKEAESLEQDAERLEGAVDKLKSGRDRFKRELQKKKRETEEAIRSHRLSESTKTAASAMESFEVGDLDGTHQEMLERLNQQTAESEARMEMALDSAEDDVIDGKLIGEAAEEQRADETLRQIKADMGMVDEPEPAESAEEAEQEPELETAAPEKTLGRMGV